MISFPAISTSISFQWRTGPPRKARWRGSSPAFSRARRPRRPSAADLRFLPLEPQLRGRLATRLGTVGGITHEAQHAENTHDAYRQPAAADRCGGVAAA